jgi:prepilin-type N-terminal cleavage/methylation domain-containing protein
MIGLNRKGFTLVEIMIVVAIIALLAAIAIPNLLRARINANHTAAATTVKSINTAAQSFAGANPGLGYPINFAAMTAPAVGPPYIDPTTDTATTGNPRQGYNFTYSLDTGGGVAGDQGTRFHVFAAPVVHGTTGINEYYCDESGAMYYISPAAATADPGPQATSGACPVGWLPLE